MTKSLSVDIKRVYISKKWIGESNVFFLNDLIVRFWSEDQ